MPSLKKEKYLQHTKKELGRELNLFCLQENTLCDINLRIVMFQWKELLIILKLVFLKPTPLKTFSSVTIEAPVIWSRVPETALPPRQLYQAFMSENVVSVGRVKVLPA